MGPPVADDHMENAFNLSFMTPSPSISPGGHTQSFFDARTATLSNEASYDSPQNLVIEQPSVAMLDSTLDFHKDLYLFDHYMDHTCRDLEIIPQVSFARKFGIPQLAVENPGILCSLMALGAACLAIDILTGQSQCSQLEDLGELISAGDRYHRTGLQSVQHQMTTDQPRDLAEAHAHAILLFPYALGRRRISHLLNDIGPPTPTSGVDPHAEHMSSIDWMIILRGITTTGRSCWSNSSVYMHDSVMATRPQKIHPAIASHVQAKLSEPSDRPLTWNRFQCRVASKHPLFPVVASTRVMALEALAQKGEKVNRLMRNSHRHDPALDVEKSSLQLARSVSLSACLMAVDLLVNLEGTIFDYDSNNEKQYPEIPVAAKPALEASPIPWLRRYASSPIYEPGLPALRTVFAWVNRTPEEYFQLLLKPLPSRTDCQIATPTATDVDREIQLFAWDIWSHWLVFAILIEDESFFTASLGVPDITNLSPWFKGLPSESSSSNAGSTVGSPTAQGQDWWPWSMCSVAQQLRKYDGEGLTG